MFPFHLGGIFISHGAERAIKAAGQKVGWFLSRHVYCDWGAEDRARNEEALKAGLEIRSEFVTGTGERIWVVTNKRRTRTTITTPVEYYRKHGGSDD